MGGPKSWAAICFRQCHMHLLGGHVGQRDFGDLSGTFSVCKMQLLGGPGSPQDLWWPKGTPMYLSAAFCRPKDPGAASGRLKVAFS